MYECQTLDAGILAASPKVDDPQMQDYGRDMEVAMSAAYWQGGY